MDQGYFCLNDEQSERLEPNLPTDTRGKPRVDDRRVISGIIHVARAAEPCNLAQSALTKAIQRLKAELGGALLLRERSMTRLTPLGEAMLPLLEVNYEAAEAARAQAASFGPGMNVRSLVPAAPKRPVRHRPAHAEEPPSSTAPCRSLQPGLALLKNRHRFHGPDRRNGPNVGRRL